MGLDQYAVSSNRNDLSYKELDDFLVIRMNERPNDPVEFSRWRSNFSLQLWMEDLCMRKTGKKESDIGAICITLSEDDLDRLKYQIRHKIMPNTGWDGRNTERLEYLDKEDLDFIGRAKIEIRLGRTVYYVANW